MPEERAGRVIIPGTEDEPAPALPPPPQPHQQVQFILEPLTGGEAYRLEEKQGKQAEDYIVMRLPGQQLSLQGAPNGTVLIAPVAVLEQENLEAVFNKLALLAPGSEQLGAEIVAENLPLMEVRLVVHRKALGGQAAKVAKQVVQPSEGDGT